MSTGERIKELRLQKGLTQDQMERITGVDQGYISLIENGRRKRVSAEMLVKLAVLLVAVWRIWSQNSGLGIRLRRLSPAGMTRFVMSL